MNISERDKQRALKFARCNCNTFDHTEYYTQCTNCGFKRVKDTPTKTKSKKLSKKDLD
jgi:hypothetical protein